MILLALFRLELQMLFWQGIAEFGCAFLYVAVNITLLVWIETLE